MWFGWLFDNLSGVLICLLCSISIEVVLYLNEIVKLDCVIIMNKESFILLFFVGGIFCFVVEF